MTLGALSLQAAQPAQAQGYYERVTQRFPTSPLAPEAHLKLGVIWHNAQRYQNSTTSLSFALRGLAQPQQRAQAHYYTGLNLRQQQRYADAFEAFDRTAKARPDATLIQEAQEAMRLLMEQQLTPDDLRQLAQRHAEEPLGAQLLLRLAQRYRDMGDIRGEQDALQQLASQYPHDPQQPEVMTRLEARCSPRGTRTPAKSACFCLCPATASSLDSAFCGALNSPWAEGVICNFGCATPKGIAPWPARLCARW